MKLGVQTYTIRDLLKDDFFGVMEKAREMGARYFEMGDYFGHKPEDVKMFFDDKDIRGIATHIGIDRLKSDINGVIEEAKMLGYEYIVLPWVGKDTFAIGWAKFAHEQLEPIGQALKNAGLTFLYHNHDQEFTLENGRPGLDILYAEADPTLVQAELDTYWAKYAGQDPVKYVNMLKGRLPICHWKDMVKDESRTFAECGYGILDWDAIIPACKAAGTLYGVIEQDTCQRNSLESLKMSVEFFRSKGITE
jgi:sugar phosphate isomerase/epimerase